MLRRYVALVGMPNGAIKLVVWYFVAILLLAEIGGAATISVGPGDSIQSVIDAAADGDVITVQSGFYRESLVVDKKLILDGENTSGGRPVIDAGGNANGMTLNAEGVTIRGFNVTNARIGIEVVSNKNEIADNEVRDCWIGIALSSSSGNLLKGNLVCDNWRGIHFKDSEDNVLYGNTIRDNKWSGIVLESSYDNLFQENIIRANYRGFELINSDENAFVGNELVENRYNDDEPPSSDSASSRRLEDMVGGQGLSSEPLSKGQEAGPNSSDTSGGANPEVEDDLFSEVFEGEPGGSVNETEPAGLQEPPIMTPEAEESRPASGLEIDAPAQDVDDEISEPKASEVIDGQISKEALSDISPEGSNISVGSGNSGEDMPAESSVKSPSETAEERPERVEVTGSEPEPGPESVSQESPAPPVEPEGPASDFVTVDSGEPRKVEGTKSKPMDIDEAGLDEVSEIGAEREELSADLQLEVAKNETAGDLAVGEDGDGATRSKSDSGAWKIYELLKSLGKIGGEETASTSVSDEMNFSEMVEVELERLDLDTVSFYSPKDMTVGVSEKVEAAIAKDVQGELAERLKGLGAPEGEVARLNVSIRSVLEGDSFLIKPHDDELQHAANEEISYWSWGVTPLKSGIQDLALHVTVVVELPDGSAVQREYKAIERRTGVDISFKHIVLYLAERVSDISSA
jgi:parallel beta-helix repeat protein